MENKCTKCDWLALCVTPEPNYTEEPDNCTLFRPIKHAKLCPKCRGYGNKKHEYENPSRAVICKFCNSTGFINDSPVDEAQHILDNI